MVQMKALQPKVYVFSQRKEYPEGATFDVKDAREAESLHLSKKAMRIPDKPAHVDLPKMRPVHASRASMNDTWLVEGADTPKKSGGRGRYQRRDMTATDGQTGEGIPLPSSLLDPPSEESTSTESEAEPEQ